VSSTLDDNANLASAVLPGRWQWVLWRAWR